jgi:hypothetical protein
MNKTYKIGDKVKVLWTYSQNGHRRGETDIATITSEDRYYYYDDNNAYEILKSSLIKDGIVIF